MDKLRHYLVYGSAMLLVSGSVAFLKMLMCGETVSTFVWMLLTLGTLALLTLFSTFVEWDQVFAGAGRGLARAGNAAAPHIRAGANAAGGAIRQDPLLYLTIFLGAVTLIFFGVAAYAGSVIALRFAIIGVFLTAASIVSYKDEWGAVEGHWNEVWLGLSLLFIPLSFVFGGNAKVASWFAVSAFMAYVVMDWDRVSRNWAGWWLALSLAGIPVVLFFGWNAGWILILLLSALAALIIVVDGWEKVSSEAWKLYSGQHGKYLAAGALIGTLIAFAAVVYFFDQSKMLHFRRVSAFGGYYPEVAVFFFQMAGLVAGITIVYAMFAEGLVFVNNRAPRR